MHFLQSGSVCSSNSDYLQQFISFVWVEKMSEIYNQKFPYRFRLSLKRMFKGVWNHFDSSVTEFYIQFKLYMLPVA